MKILLVIIITFAFLSCKKVKGCLECKIQGTVNGVTYDETRIYCGDDPNPQFTDANGNQLNSFDCKRR